MVENESRLTRTELLYHAYIKSNSYISNQEYTLSQSYLTSNRDSDS